METGINLLLVEYDSLLAENIKQSLRKEEINVFGAAKNLKEALQFMKYNSVDIALIDVELDGPEDGVATAAELLKIKWMPIIYITGESPLEINERMEKTYPAAFLEKPLSMKELLAQIKLALINFNAGNLRVPSAQSEYLFFPADKGHVGIKVKEILYIEANGNYSRLFLSREYFVELYPQKAYNFVFISSAMGNILRQLPPNFYKLSRSVVINLNQISKIETNRLFIKNEEIPIPTGRYKALMEQVVVVKSS